MARKLAREALERVAGGHDPGAESSRDRVLTDSEFALFWRAAADDPVFGPLYKFLALTGQRRDEARGATWDEFDLESGFWTIPASRAKNKREHLIPLSAPALAVLRSLPRIRRRPTMVFTTTGSTMISGMARAKYRLDRRMLALARDYFGFTGLTIALTLPGHGTRRSRVLSH